MRGYDEAHRILEERTETLTRIAGALLLHETLTADQIATLARSEALRPTVEPGVDHREQHEAADRKRELAGSLSRAPEPGLWPAWEFCHEK